MAANNLPPLSYNEMKDLPYTVQEYLRVLRNVITGVVSGVIPWLSVDKAGSNMNELTTRNHNDLQNIQGGASNDYYHFTSADKTDLTDSGDSTLHFHATDRARANHTGTQLMATISNLPTLVSGTYTPTLTGVTNVAASTAYQCQYIRVGAVVTVSGKVDVDPTAAVATQLGISLPVASNLGALEDCAGTAAAPAVAGQSAAIYADITNDRAQMEWVAVDLANRSMYFTFTYEVI